MRGPSSGSGNVSHLYELAGSSRRARHRPCSEPGEILGCRRGWDAIDPEADESPDCVGSSAVTNTRGHTDQVLDQSARLAPEPVQPALDEVVRASQQRGS